MVQSVAALPDGTQSEQAVSVLHDDWSRDRCRVQRERRAFRHRRYTYAKCHITLAVWRDWLRMQSSMLFKCFVPDLERCFNDRSFIVEIVAPASRLLAFLKPT